MNAEVLPLRQSPPRSQDLATLLETRRSVSAGRLVEPGPTTHELQRILTIAARVPDHGSLTPWRFILVQNDMRRALAARLGDACLSAAKVSPEAQEQAQRTAQKLKMLFSNPPLVVIVVSRAQPAAAIPVQEQILSAGAACMNLMAAATAFGYSANWLTGWTAAHPAARPILGLADGETIAGIIPIGTAAELPPERARPDLSQVVSSWAG